MPAAARIDDEALRSTLDVENSSINHESIRNLGIALLGRKKIGAPAKEA